MDYYAIVLSVEQKELIQRAIDVFSQLTVGQTHAEREAARKLAPLLNKMHRQGTNDLSKQ